MRAQTLHICCNSEDCAKAAGQPNLQLIETTHLFGSLADQGGRPFRLSKVELRKWVSPTRQVPLKQSAQTKTATSIWDRLRRVSIASFRLKLERSNSPSMRCGSPECVVPQPRGLLVRSPKNDPHIDASGSRTIEHIEWGSTAVRHLAGLPHESDRYPDASSSCLDRFADASECGFPVNQRSHQIPAACWIRT